MGEKRCCHCKEIKIIDEFHKNKHNQDGYAFACKKCKSEEDKKYRKENMQQLKESKRIYYLKNKEQEDARVSNWVKNNTAKRKTICQKYYIKHIDRINIVAKKWQSENVDRVNELQLKRYYKKMTIPMNRINHRISAGIYACLKTNKNNWHWETLVGYELKDLIQHLEKQFKDGMSWDNLGDWHVDHVIPKSLFEFNSHIDREFKQCWSLCNLQPLWREENQSKGNKTNKTIWKERVRL